MKKTLSLLLAALMVMTIIAIPAMAATTEAQFTNRYMAYMDLSSYEVGTVLTNDNVADTGVISFAGTGTSIRNVTIDGTTTQNVGFVNPIDIRTQSTDESISKVTVVEVDGEKMLKLEVGQNYDNAGIALKPINGATLMGSALQRNYAFDFYQPPSGSQINSLNLGFAKIGADGTLSYYAVNELNGENPSGITAAQLPSLYPTTAHGVSPVLYFEAGIPKIHTTNRHNVGTGAYTGSGSFGDGARAFLNRDLADGTTVAVDDTTKIYDHWYSNSFGLFYLSGVGIQIKSQSSYDVDNETWSYGTCTIPLTATELADLSSVQIVPIISLNAHTQGTRYTYIKDVRATVEAEYDKVTSQATKTIMSENFESATIGDTNNTSYNGSYINGFGIYSNRFLTGIQSSEKQSVSIAANPSYVGNNSAQVLKISGTTKDSGPWAGFRSQAIPASVFTSNADGATIMYDTYRSNSASFGNGRLYFHAVTNTSGTTENGSQNDLSDTYKIMSHMTSSGTHVQFMFNNSNGNGTNTSRFSALASSNWVRIAFNLRAAADGTAIVKIRSCDLATGTWTEWTNDITFPMNLFAKDYLVWAESYNNGADVNLYYDNFALVAGDVSPVAEIKGSTDNLVYTTDTITATLNAPVANEALLKKVTLVDSSDAVVEAEISSVIENGKTIVTIDPVEDLTDDETYTIDFAGNKTILGEAIVNAQFTVQEDWTDITSAVVVFDGNAKLVTGDVLKISMEVDGGSADTSTYTVYSDSDAVQITANVNEYCYEVTPLKDGAANIYVRSLLYPGAGIRTYAVEAVAAETVYTATYYLGEEVVHTEKVPVNAVPDGYTVEDEGFAGWSTTAGGSVAPLAPITEDTSYYAVIGSAIDITVVSNNEAMGEITDTTISIPAGGTLSAAPQYTLTNDALYALKGWELNGETLTTAELLATYINEATTITAIFKQVKINFGDEFDFTTMTAEEFAASPLSEDTNFVLTEGEGIELVKSAGTGYSFNFLEDATPSGTYVIEFDYIPSGSGFQGFDSGLYGKEGAAKKLHGHYINATGLADLCFNAAGGEQANFFQNLRPALGEKHTVKYVIDYTTGKALTILDGVAGIENANNSYDIAYPDAGAPRLWGPSVKTGGSMILTRFKFDKLEDAKVVKVNVEFDENVDDAGFLNTSSNICTDEMYMLEGTKIDLGVTISDIDFEVDAITAGSGSVAENGDNYIYTAGAADATISVTSKNAYVVAKFEVGEGTYVSGDLEQTLSKGQTPVAPEVTAPDGKVFLGWSPAVGAIYEDTTFVATYTDAETLDIAFTVENEDSATIDASAKAIKDGSLVALPAYTAINGSTFLYWMDDAGNKYTNEELLAKTFAEAETITAVFKQAYVNTGVFDFTQHDLETFGGTVSGVYSQNEDGSLHFEGSSGTTNNALISGNLNGATSGTWVFTFDYRINDGAAGSINGEVRNSSGNTQSMYLIGDNLFVRKGDGSGNPDLSVLSFEQLGLLTDGNRHVVKAYYDLDNLAFRVSIDGHFADISTYQLPSAELSRISFNLHNGVNADVYAIGFEKLAEEDYPEFTASTAAYDYSASCATYVYEGPVSAGDKVIYRAYNATGYQFDGWYLDDAAEPVSTELTYTHTVTGDYKLVPKYSVRYITITYYTADHVTFEGVEGDSWTTDEFVHGTIPSQELEVCEPTLVIDEGYTFLGWASKANGHLFTGHTYVDIRNDGSVPELVAVVRKTFDASVNGSIISGELGRTIEVPVNAETTIAIAKGVIQVEYDDEALEYVGATVADAYAGKVVVAQTATPSVLTITIDSEEEIEIKDVIATLKFKALEKSDGSEITYSINNVFGLNDEVYEMISFTTTPSTVVVKALKGDANQDGRIDIFDAVNVLRSVAGITSLTGDGLAAADVDGDSEVTLSDATRILKYIARLIVSF